MTTISTCWIWHEPDKSWNKEKNITKTCCPKDSKSFLLRSLMGNVIETVRITGSDYWAAYVGEEKIKTDGLKKKPEPMSLPIKDLS